MDAKQFRAILDKFGKENLHVIILDNCRVVTLDKKDEEGNYLPFDEQITIDDELDSIIYTELPPMACGAKNKEEWEFTIVTPIEGIQGLNFTKNKKQRDCWDYSIR